MRLPILSVEQSREADRLATETYGLPSFLLMENAGRGLAHHILKVLDLFPRTITHVVFLCGPGKNGGDGFAAARHLMSKHSNIRIYLTHSSDKLTGDSLMNFNILKNLGITAHRFSDFESDKRTIFNGIPLVFVDCMLGTGLRGEPEGVFKDAIQEVAHLKKYHNTKVMVVAADVPTGLNGDEGPLASHIMPADVTVTFGCAKKGLLLPASKPHVGRLEVVDIGLPEPLLHRFL